MCLTSMVFSWYLITLYLRVARTQSGQSCSRAFCASDSLSWLLRRCNVGGTFFLLNMQLSFKECGVKHFFSWERPWPKTWT